MKIQLLLRKKTRLKAVILPPSLNRRRNKKAQSHQNRIRRRKRMAQTRHNLKRRRRKMSQTKLSLIRGRRKQAAKTQKTRVRVVKKSIKAQRLIPTLTNSFKIEQKSRMPSLKISKLMKQSSKPLRVTISRMNKKNY